jgi:RNA-binding protein
MKKGKNEMIKEVRSQSATIILGKKGVTGEFIEEVKRQLKRKKVIKIRVLRSILAVKGMDELTSEITIKTGFQVLETRGYTILLVRRHI